MKTLATAIIVLISMFPVMGKENQVAPRWLSLGDDNALKETYKRSNQVLLVCIYAVDLQDVGPSFSTTVLKATVVKAFKGKLLLGDRIEIAFQNDGTLASEEDRKKFIERANTASEGGLRFAFLHEGKDKRFLSELFLVPNYSMEMSAFLESLAHKSRKGEQDGGGNALEPPTHPSTAPTKTRATP